MVTAAEFIALPGRQAGRAAGLDRFRGGRPVLGIPALDRVQGSSVTADVEGKRVLVIVASSVVGHYATPDCGPAARAPSSSGTVGSEKKAAHARAAEPDETSSTSGRTWWPASWGGAYRRRRGRRQHRHATSSCGRARTTSLPPMSFRHRTAPWSLCVTTPFACLQLAP